MDISLDLETLGTRAGCAVLSIGAVAFDHTTGLLGPEFYCVINRKSCTSKGLHEDPDTLSWWSRQTDEARKVLAEAETAANGLGGALIQFTGYLEKFGKRGLRIWTLGADFDLPILGHCYAVIDHPRPWPAYSGRCFRTLRELGNIKSEYKHGVAHSAIDDAKNQALLAMDILRKLSASSSNGNHT